MKIKAYAAKKPKSMLEEFSYEAEVGDNDVAIKITHCGICHSDIHLIDNDWGISNYPLVPGHEVIGTITGIGKNVNNLKKGQRVGVGWQSGSCMECEFCISGKENLCSNSKPTCVGHYGGFGEYLITDSRFVFSIPENMSSETAAPLLCGGITVYSPLRNVLPSSRVGIIGIGGLGHLAIQFAHALGCEVTAFSSSPDKEKEAKKLGAHHFRTKTSQEKLYDFILSTANVDLDWSSYLQMLRPNGVLCFVGASPGNTNIPVRMLLHGQKSIKGSVIGDRHTITEMLKFAARHNIKAQVEVVPMSKVNEAVDKVRKGKARYRMVLKN